jgi:hypothetical protein
VADCPWCLRPNRALDTQLLLNGPDAGAQELASASDAQLAKHVLHVRERLLLNSQRPLPPAMDADLLVKTLWVEESLFRLTFGADDLAPESINQALLVMQQKNQSLNGLTRVLRLEAEITGRLEKAKLKGKREAEREMAQSEQEMQQVLSEDEQLRYFANTLKLHGYQVQKRVESAAIDITPTQEKS